MSLHFEYVRWKNLLSTGNAFTEIRLDKSPSTLIIGKNGEGKSTLGDAICLALYNKPFRKIKKIQLVNSINGGGLETEIAFRGHDQKHYVVRRGIKPDFFEIQRDGIPLDQEAASKDSQLYLEQHIIRLNFKSFTQIVFLGSAGFVPFMQLSTGSRREIIDDLLDIRMFSTMAILLKDRLNAQRIESATVESELAHDHSLHSHFTTQEQKNQDRSQEKIDACDRNILAQMTTRANLVIRQDALRVNIADLTASLDGERAAIDHQTKLMQLEKLLEKKLAKLNAAVLFFETNNVCPTCTQDIPDEFCRAQTHDKHLAVESVQAGLLQLRKDLKEGELQQAKFDTLRAKLALEAGSEAQVQAEIRDTLTAEAILKDQRTQYLIPQNLDMTETLRKLAESIAAKGVSLKFNAEAIEVMTVASVILRDDGIKSRIVAQYIPIINQLVNKYLAALDFFVSFELNENFEEVIRSRYRDDFSYHSFSEGEKMRIDLAILFTWRAVAKLKNSASTNILILDEVFDASLDSAGCDDFLKLIHTLEDCSVFVISHKGDTILDKFRDTIRFEKQQNFSRIVAAS